MLPMTTAHFILYITFPFLKVPPNVTTTLKAFNTAPTLLWWISEENMDIALNSVAYTGLALSGFLMLWGAGNAIIFILLWMLYHSLVNVGQRWFVLASSPGSPIFSTHTRKCATLKNWEQPGNEARWVHCRGQYCISGFPYSMQSLYIQCMLFVWVSTTRLYYYNYYV